MANPSRLSAALAAWDRRTSHRAEDIASLGMELAEAAREVLGAQPLAPSSALKTPRCTCPAGTVGHYETCTAWLWAEWEKATGGAR